MMNQFPFRTAALILGMLACSAPAVVLAQVADSIEIEPAEATLKVGETLQFKAIVKDADGNVLPDAQVLFFGNRRTLTVTPGGLVTANYAGEHGVTAMAPATRIEGAPDSYTLMWAEGARGKADIKVPVPELTAIKIIDVPGAVYAGTTTPVRVQGTDETGTLRNDVVPALSINDESIASTDGFGSVTALSPGKTTLTAKSDKIEATLSFNVLENPVRTIELSASLKEARTGDVIHFTALPRDEQGRLVNHVPVEYSLQTHPDPSHPNSVGAGASALLLEDGRFVANQQGFYTVIATSGNATDRQSVRITQRDVSQKLEFVGHARISDHATSDFWVWEAPDGRDYAIVGGWNAGGNCYFYDVTDPENMELVDTVQVDARTVNDVKISEDGSIAVISREGASNRRNGFVILDVSNPREVEILSTFDDQLTAGVHNVFIYDDHVYAVNLSRFDVINIEDPRNPYRVSRFESTSPGPSVHDVWVRDGVLYQSGSTDGVVLVDVGGGGKEGTPAHPVEMARMPQLTDWNHAVWPFKSESANKFYVLGGDETMFPDPRIPEDEMFDPTIKLPVRAGGWIHFIEFDDLENPKEIARYKLDDFGVHNYWVDWEKELLYVAYYQGGLRILDISGELIGDLYAQGREIANFYSDDPEGFLPNSTMAWGPQPHKGTIFFTDYYSGLWAVKLLPPEDEEDGDDAEEDNKGG